MERLRTFLRRNLSKGFWFPLLQGSLRFVYRRLVVGSYFNSWLKLPGEEKAPPGASELIVAASLTVSIIWLFLLDVNVPVLRSQPARVLGGALALYQITSIAVVAAYTVFVFEGRIHSVPRSLASFLVNVVEICAYSTIFLALSGCAPSARSHWSALYRNLASLFGLAVPPTSGEAGCLLFAHYELVVGGGILFIMVGSVIGAIVRPAIRR